mmetsp:Transcript_26063/g.39448  ORF Transcript_26063/g.39448 Transcript_26063/m.39448 type:complete len:108 (+) Transcript_26063:93-416(+)
MMIAANNVSVHDSLTDRSRSNESRNSSRTALDSSAKKLFASGDELSSSSTKEQDTIEKEKNITLLEQWLQSSDKTKTYVPINKVRFVFNCRNMNFFVSVRKKLWKIH